MVCVCVCVWRNASRDCSILQICFFLFFVDMFRETGILVSATASLRHHEKWMKK